MKNSKLFNTLVTAILYSLTIFLYDKAETISQYNLSNIAKEKIIHLSNQANNLISQY